MLTHDTQPAARSKKVQYSWQGREERCREDVRFSRYQKSWKAQFALMCSKQTLRASSFPNHISFAYFDSPLGERTKVTCETDSRSLEESSSDTSNRRISISSGGHRNTTVIRSPVMLSHRIQRNPAKNELVCFFFNVERSL
jgi:hypothetical protein